MDVLILKEKLDEAYKKRDVVQFIRILSKFVNENYSKMTFLFPFKRFAEFSKFIYSEPYTVIFYGDKRKLEFEVISFSIPVDDEKNEHIWVCFGSKSAVNLIKERFEDVVVVRNSKFRKPGHEWLAIAKAMMRWMSRSEDEVKLRFSVNVSLPVSLFLKENDFGMDLGYGLLFLYFYFITKFITGEHEEE